MRRYHHIGIPTNESKPGETPLKDLKVFVVSHQKRSGAGSVTAFSESRVHDRPVRAGE